jgi:acetoin utilization protein AcuB
MSANVKAWMTGDPVSLGPEVSALEALELMMDRSIRHLPVVDGDRRVIGVVSLDDLRAALPGPIALRTPLPPEQRGAALEWSVADVMTHAPLTVTDDTGLADAAERMADARIGCLPVVTGDGRLVAILTETDLLHALATLLWTESRRAPREEEPLEALVAELRHERERLERRLRHERASSLDTLARRRLAALELALERSAGARLGACERCGGRIAVARLRALPGTTLCIRCARTGEA